MVNLFIFSFLFLSTPLWAQDCIHDTNSFKCVEYVKAYDADTLTFNIPHMHPLIGKEIKVRLSGVDTPEIKTTDICEKTKGLQAKKEVEKLLEKARRIDLENITRGKYFRILANVKFDDTSLSQYLLQKKLAHPYDGKTKRTINWCK